MADRAVESFLAHGWHARHLFGAIPLFAIGTGALYPLIALELASAGAGAAFIGLVTSAWYLGTFLGSALSGPLIRRLGHHLAFTLAAALAAAATWGLNLSDEPAAWLVLRFLGGLGLGAYYLLMESWISGLATPATRGRMLASYEVLRIGAVALGPLLLVMVSTHNAIALIGVLFLAAILPVARARPPSVEFEPVDWHAAFGVFACSPCTLALVVVAGFLSSSFYGFGAIYAEGQGFSKAEIAVFVSVTLFAPVVSQLPIGALADRHGRAPLCALISALAALAAIALALGLPASFFAVTVTAALVSSLSLPLYALGTARLVDGGHEVITATTAGLVGYNAGTFLGPFGAALVMDHGSSGGLYAWVGLCLVCGLGLSALAMAQPRARCCPL